MKQRIITAVIALLALLLVLFVVPEQMALLVIVAVMIAGAWEWSAFLGICRQYRPPDLRCNDRDLVGRGFVSEC